MQSIQEDKHGEALVARNQVARIAQSHLFWLTRLGEAGKVAINRPRQPKTGRKIVRTGRKIVLLDALVPLRWF